MHRSGKRARGFTHEQRDRDEWVEVICGAVKPGALLPGCSSRASARSPARPLLCTLQVWADPILPHCCYRCPPCPARYQARTPHEIGGCGFLHWASGVPQMGNGHRITATTTVTSPSWKCEHTLALRENEAGATEDPGSVVIRQSSRGLGLSSARAKGLSQK